jgi:hypothetical protein
MFTPGPGGPAHRNHGGRPSLGRIVMATTAASAKPQGCGRTHRSRPSRRHAGHRARGALPPVAERIFDFNGWTRLLEIGPGDEWETAHWAYASAGAAWIDLAQLAADVVATGHALGPQMATDRAYRLLRTLPPEASRFVVGLAGMWCIRAATVPDTFHPSISTWRRARSAALRPQVTRLIADLSDSA